MNARIIVGANYGDEGKGTVVAKYTKESENVLNVLTNGGPQRGHSILTKDGNITYRHFGSGTYYGADNYYSRFFILNPVQFAIEHKELIVKPDKIYRDPSCRWTTIYDMMANLISEQLQKRHASCCMGIWNTVKRFTNQPIVLFDTFIKYSQQEKLDYLNNVKLYYEKEIDIPDNYKNIWNNPNLALHFILDCDYMYYNTIVIDVKNLDYQNIIFENGQGLLLSDKGVDSYEATPSITGVTYAVSLIKDFKNIDSVTAHYVTRPYLTRHGDGSIQNGKDRKNISNNIKEDRTNHYNEFQGNFRYGILDIKDLHNRIIEDCRGINYEIELTHCDEMDRVKDFKDEFTDVNVYDTALI